jgi:hypothetical protein
MNLKIRMVAAACAALALASVARAEESATTAPDWFLDEIRLLTAEGGRWIADNMKYRNDQETFEEYGIEWRASFDGTSMTGRLFGLKGGAEVGDFWEFRQYWHPGRKEAVIEQFGWRGAVGIGRMWREGAQTKSEQTFYWSDGSVTRDGHVSSFPNPETHDTESFSISGETWTAKRRYVWKRAPADG